jgi:hypothetical protein
MIKLDCVFEHTYDHQNIIGFRLPANKICNYSTMRLVNDYIEDIEDTVSNLAEDIVCNLDEAGVIDYD